MIYTKQNKYNVRRNEHIINEEKFDLEVYKSI